jgi:2-haloacid dehalogenase
MGDTLEFSRFEALTFDCYGTLIDWERGILDALRSILDAHEVDPADDRLLESFARHEAPLERGPYKPYREILAGCLDGIAGEFGFQPSPRERAGFAASVADWPAFPDSVAALRQLADHFRLGVLTNCDDDLFAASNRRLGVTFDWVVTAQQARSYKPSPRNFELLLARVGLPRQRILHVAQSRYHDHVPARALGIATAWIDRRRGRPGHGATPEASARPDLTAPDLATFARLATG